MRRALHHWLLSLPTSGGAVEISGSCLTMQRWWVVRILCRSLIMAVCVALVMAGSVTWWSDGRGVAWIEGPHAEFAWAVRLWAQKNWLTSLPMSVQAFDWLLMVGGALLSVVSRDLTRLLSAILLLMVGPLVGKRFRIVISATQLKFRRWGRWKVLQRGALTADRVQVRCVEASEYYSSLAPAELERRRYFAVRITHPPAIVEIVQDGTKRHMLLMARRTDEAEAIVARCNEALQSTRMTFAGRPTSSFLASG